MSVLSIHLATLLCLTSLCFSLLLKLPSSTIPHHRLTPSFASVKPLAAPELSKKQLRYFAKHLIATLPLITAYTVLAEPTINLNVSEPEITDVCWLDVQVEGESAPRRLEISLYGEVVPATAQNFMRLCRNENGLGYRGSSVFRIIDRFSIQAGNIGQRPDETPSRVGRFGRAADGKPFPPENFLVGHDHPQAGVVSMMKDIAAGGLQDSRFFITLSPSASWADGKYVAFGRVTKGLDLIGELARLEVEPPSNHPKKKVTIIDSGCYNK